MTITTTDCARIAPAFQLQAGVEDQLHCLAALAA